MALHLNTPDGPKPITPEVARALVEQGRLAPTLKALSTDGGATWQSYQELVAQVAGRKAPAAPAPPVAPTPPPAPTAPVTPPPAPPAPSQAPQPSRAESDGLFASEMKAPLPLDTSQMSSVRTPAAPAPQAAQAPMTAPASNGGDIPFNVPAAPIPPRPGAQAATFMPNARYRGTMLYGLILLALLFTPHFQEERISSEDPYNNYFGRGSADKEETKTKTSIVFPGLVPLFHMDSMTREDRTGVPDIYSIINIGGAARTAFLVVVGGTLLLMGAICQRRKGITLFSVLVGWMVTMAMLSVAAGEGAPDGYGPVLLRIGAMLGIALVVTWNEPLSADTRRLLMLFAGGLMLLGVVLPIQSNGFSAVYFTTAFDADFPGPMFARMCVILAMLTGAASGLLLLVFGAGKMAHLPNQRWIVLTGIASAMGFLVLGGTTDEMSAAQTCNMLTGVMMSGGSIAILPLALVHLLRGSTEAKLARQAEIRAVIQQMK